MISALIITKNEAANVGRCIASLKEVVDEIIVLDSGSEDDTVAVSEEAGAVVFNVAWEGYARTKNKGHELCKNDYILSVDADEELSDELKQSILDLRNKTLKGAYLLDRHNLYLDKWVKRCGWYPDWKIRLFNKREAKWTGDYVHEKLVLKEGVQTRKLNGPLLHHSITSIKQHKDTVAKYALLAAQKRIDAGKKGNTVKGAITFLTTFTRIFIFKGGFIEGRRGYLIAYYSGLSKWLRQKHMVQLRRK